jgi:hypothetical protein
MNNNLFWPVYKNLENEFIQLMFSIHIDDKQLTVYSVKICDLIIRAVSEIETLSKELYHTNGGDKSGNIKFDEVALQHLDNIWKLSDKIVLISSINCYLSNNVIFPFKKTESRTGKSYLTFTWNNAYQNLKHDRSKNLEFASLKNLFDAMSALFVLNIYFKDNVFKLGKDPHAQNFHENQGSEIFSVKLYNQHGFKFDGSLTKDKDYDECLYIFKPVDDTVRPFLKILENLSKKEKELQAEFLLHSLKEKLKDQNIENIDEMKSFINDELNKKSTDFFKGAMKHVNPIEFKNKMDQIQYEAVLNKNQF